jgi:acyl-CoA reductase-like NAD-dependent aldehyde dehydrogenase
MSIESIESGAPRAPEHDTTKVACVEPSTRAPLGVLRAATPADVAAVVARARAAQASFRETSFATRRRVLERVLAHVLDHADELCEIVCRVSGKTRENAMMGEIWPVAEKIRWTIANGERHLRPERVSSGMLMHKRATIEYAPRGVVGAIVPWNYPLQNVMNPAVPALMAGNAAVIKASEWIAWSSARFQRIFDEALAGEGISPDLVRIVDGHGDTGAALVKAGADVLIFIGSVPNGRRVLEAASRVLTPVILELGGKDPLIVCDDADLEQAVHAAMNGVFINCGQNCVAAERILVQEAIYDRFERRAGELARALRQGPPLGGEVVDVGGMTTPIQLEIVDRLVRRAVEQGARVVAGGRRARASEGAFFEPTVLADVTPDMEIMQEETFGPVMLLCRVRDDDHAVSVANATRFGLGSSVMCKDPRRARNIARRIEAGMTAINEFGGVTYMVQDLPFGGVKESGFGRLNGRDGLRALTHPRALLEDRLPLSFANKLFPVGAKDYDTTRSTIELLYGTTLGRRLRGARGLLRALTSR